MTKLSAREVIIYLYAKHRKWEDIFKTITGKTPLREDIGVCREVIRDFEKEIPAAKIVTLMDDEMPKSLKERTNPPFLLRYEGDISLLDKDQLIALDCSYEQLDTVPAAMAEKGARIVVLNQAMGDSPASSLSVLAPTKDGEISTLVVYDEDLPHTLLTMGVVADRFVSLEGHDEFANMANNAGHGMKFASPGPSGCTCNQLIKNGWHLCDCTEDFLYMEPPKTSIDKPKAKKGTDDD